MSGKLFVDDHASFPFSIATAPRAGVVKFDETALKRLETAIVADKIDVVILDPFISFHGVSENDNGGIDAVVKCLAAIAERTNCCIEITHHVRKAVFGQATLTVDDARGGSAIINAVRSGRVINRMTAEEAELARPPIADIDRHSYVRVDRGKRNMAPPDKASWFRLINQPLANGDNVQALIVWTFPETMVGVTIHDTEFIRELVHATPRRADSRSDEWLGLDVAKRLGLNPYDVGDIKKIQKIIGVWLNNEVFRKCEMKDKERKKRMFFVGAGYVPEPAKPTLTVVVDNDEESD
jgi:hypothetical protein